MTTNTERNKAKDVEYEVDVPGVDPSWTLEQQYDAAKTYVESVIPTIIGGALPGGHQARTVALALFAGAGNRVANEYFSPETVVGILTNMMQETMKSVDDKSPTSTLIFNLLPFRNVSRDNTRAHAMACVGFANAFISGFIELSSRTDLDQGGLAIAIMRLMLKNFRQFEGEDAARDQYRQLADVFDEATDDDYLTGAEMDAQAAAKKGHH